MTSLTFLGAAGTVIVTRFPSHLARIRL